MPAICIPGNVGASNSVERSGLTRAGNSQAAVTGFVHVFRGEMTINQDRDRVAEFEQHVVPYLDILLRVALALTRNYADAEDLVQDTLLRAYRGIDRFDGRYPRAWLLTILRRAHINRNRRQRPVLVADQDAALRELAATSDGSDDPERLVVDNKFDGAVADAFYALPESFRQVVELVDISGLGYQEAATVLSIPIGTVMSRLHRARIRMKKRLFNDGYTREGKR